LRRFYQERLIGGKRGGDAVRRAASSNAIGGGGNGRVPARPSTRDLKFLRSDG